MSLTQSEKQQTITNFPSPFIAQRFLPKADSRQPLMRILCLWFPNWSIQRAIRAQPELRNQPIALVASEARKKTSLRTIIPARIIPAARIAACCEKAVHQGVRPGTPLAEAQTLVPNLHVAAYNLAADRQALLKLAEICERFSPRVAVEESDEPESLLLDISNLEHLYGSEAKLIEQVEKFFTRRKYQLRLAAAGTIGAAWAAAHFTKGVPCPRKVEPSVSMLT